MNPTSNQIVNKSAVPGDSVTTALNHLYSNPSSGGSGDMLKAIYDTDGDGKVDYAETADSVAWDGVSGKPILFSPSAHAHSITEVTSLQSSLDGKANLNGDNTFTGGVVYSGSAVRFKADFSNATVANRLMFQTSTANSPSTVRVIPSGTSTVAALQVGNSSDPATSSAISISVDSGQVLFNSQKNGSGTFLPILWSTSDLNRLKLETDGTFTSISSAIGYGPGAGGTAIQPTNKSTAVVLNKPSGRITMSGAELAAGAEVYFTVNNSFVNSSDLVSITANWNPSAAYTARVYYITNGSFNVAVKNTTGALLSDAVILNFAIMKVSTS